MPQYGTADTNHDLLLHYDFEEESGDNELIRDQSSSKNHGEYVGTPPSKANSYETALTFTQDTGYVRVDFEEQKLQDGFTIVVFVKNGYQDYHSGIVASDAWRLTAPYDRYEFTSGESRAKYERVEPGTWYHLAVVYQDDIVRLYVDGELVDTSTETGNLSADAVLIGQRPGGYPYEGQISEIKFYERSLTTEEVRATISNQEDVPLVFYSDWFGMTASLALLLTAFLGAQLEARYRA